MGRPQTLTAAGVGQPEPAAATGTPAILLEGLHAGNVAAGRDLVQAIEDDREPECDPAEARLTIEMIAACFESARVGAPVRFPLKTRVNPLTLM